MPKPALIKLSRGPLPLWDPQRAGALLLGKQPGAAPEASWEMLVSCFCMLDPSRLQHCLSGPAQSSGLPCTTPRLPTPTQTVTEPNAIATVAATHPGLAGHAGSPRTASHSLQMGEAGAGVRAAPQPSCSYRRSPCALTINSPFAKPSWLPVTCNQIDHPKPTDSEVLYF